MTDAVAYYHIHLTDNPLIWSTIFIEQMKCIEDSGLNKQLKKMRITCISQDDDRIGMFVKLCESYKIPIELRIVKNPFDNDNDMLYHRDSNSSFTENITLKQVYDDCKEHDMNVLYFHSKGSTSYTLNVNVDNIVKHKEYYYWRSFMNWAVLENWNDCVNALQTHDIAGGDYQSDPSPHFCGTFWWSKSSHIKQLPDPLDKKWWYDLKDKTTNEWIKYEAPARMYDEFWIGAREGIKVYDVVNIQGKNAVNGCLTKLDYERFKK